MADLDIRWQQRFSQYRNALQQPGNLAKHKGNCLT
jgi:hypothetical protein